MGGVNSVKIFLVTVTVKGHFAALELLDGSCFVPTWSPTSTTCKGGGEVGKGRTEGRGGRGGRDGREGRQAGKGEMEGRGGREGRDGREGRQGRKEQKGGGRIMSKGGE